MSTSKIRSRHAVFPHEIGFALLVATGVVTGCADLETPTAWNLDEPSGAEQSGPHPDTSTVNEPGRAHDADRDDTDGVSARRDTGVDTTSDEDARGRRVEMKGLYLWGAAPPTPEVENGNRDGFLMPNYRSLERTDVSTPHCEFRSSVPKDEGARWYVKGIGKSKLLRAPRTESKRDDWLAVVDIEGRLHEAVSTASDGSPVHFLDVNSYEVHSCETFEAYGGCLEPRKQDRCFTGFDDVEDRTNRPEFEVVARNLNAQHRRYELRFDFGFDYETRRGAEIGSAIEFYRRTERPVRLPLADHRIWFGGRFSSRDEIVRCRYERDSIVGWIREIRGPDDSVDALALHLVGNDYLSAQGSCPDPPGEIWGRFPVDRSE